MRFLVIGLGSMGKRRIRNLLANRETDIIGLDKRADRREEAEAKYGITTYGSLDEVTEMDNVGAFIISVPPDRHMEYAHYAFDHGKHCFIEASVVDDDLERLINKNKQKPSIKICPSCTLRFHPSIKLIKEIVASGRLGKLSNFSYHSGQYLPDWHPWEDISEYYVSKRETGGCREIVPFELTWMNWVFGDIEEVLGLKGKTIDLSADIDDAYAMAIRYESGVLGTLIVDVVSRMAVRKLVINGSQGQLQWDWNKKCVELFDATEGRRIDYFEPQGSAVAGYNQNIIEEMYIEEIKRFIASARDGEQFPNTLEEDYKILKNLYQAEKERK